MQNPWNPGAWNKQPVLNNPMIAINQQQTNFNPATLSPLQLQQYTQWQQQYQAWHAQYGQKFMESMNMMQQTPYNPPLPPNEQPPPPPAAENPINFPEQEKDFEEQYKNWVEQYEKWKKENEGHPDQVQYKKYEVQWENMRKQLNARREELKRQKVEPAEPAGNQKENVKNTQDKKFPLPMNNQQQSPVNTEQNFPPAFSMPSQRNEQPRFGRGGRGGQNRGRNSGKGGFGRNRNNEEATNFNNPAVEGPKEDGAFNLPNKRGPLLPEPTAQNFQKGWNAGFNKPGKNAGPNPVDGPRNWNRGGVDSNPNWGQNFEEENRWQRNFNDRPGGPDARFEFNERPRNWGPNRFNCPQNEFNDNQRPGRFDGPQNQFHDGPGNQRPGHFDGPHNQFNDGPGHQRPGRFDGPQNQFMDGQGNQRPGCFDGPQGQFNDGPGNQRPGRFDGPHNQFNDGPGHQNQRPGHFDGPQNQFNDQGPNMFDDGPGNRGPNRFDGPMNQFNDDAGNCGPNMFNEGSRNSGLDRFDEGPDNYGPNEFNGGPGNCGPNQFNDRGPNPFMDGPGNRGPKSNFQDGPGNMGPNQFNNASGNWGPNQFNDGPGNQGPGQFNDGPGNRGRGGLKISNDGPGFNTSGGRGNRGRRPPSRQFNDGPRGSRFDGRGRDDFQNNSESPGGFRGNGRRGAKCARMDGEPRRWTPDAEPREGPDANFSDQNCPNSTNPKIPSLLDMPCMEPTEKISQSETNSNQLSGMVGNILAKLGVAPIQPTVTVEEPAQGIEEAIDVHPDPKPVLDPATDLEWKPQVFDYSNTVKPPATGGELQFEVKDYGHTGAQRTTYDYGHGGDRAKTFDYAHGGDRGLRSYDYDHGGKNQVFDYDKHDSKPSSTDGFRRSRGQRSPPRHRRSRSRSPYNRPRREENRKATTQTTPSNRRADSPKDSVGPAVSVDDLILPPGRFSRPQNLVFIFRGISGSGKSHVTKLIKEKEIELGGTAPRILCLDDYFMVESEEAVKDEDTGTMKKVLKYEYDASMESTYETALLKAFRKTISDFFFQFIIVDSVNKNPKEIDKMWSFAKLKGFQVYICEMDNDVSVCYKRNIHNRTEKDVEAQAKNWRSVSKQYLRLDVRSLLQSEAIADVVMEDVDKSDTVTEKTAQKEHEEDVEDEPTQSHFLKSKWDDFQSSGLKLDLLDGIPKKKSQGTTIEEYLSTDDWPSNDETLPGKKRVRWADVEEQRQQNKMRAIGFVVGQTDWTRMMDPTFGESALTRTKYI